MAHYLYPIAVLISFVAATAAEYCSCLQIRNEATSRAYVSQGGHGVFST
jgi:hypothetical protein